MKRYSHILTYALIIASLSIGWKNSSPKNATRTDFGKIYLTETHLFVSELNKGINLYDITNLSSIHSIGYINIEGNADMIVRGDILYADSYEDLWVFDISDRTHPVFIDSIPNVFKINRIQNKIIANSGNDYVGGMKGCFSGCGASATAPTSYDKGAANGGRETSGTSGNGQTGQGGSMARFVINDKWLYCIDVSEMIVFDIADPRKPKLEGRVNIGFGIETLFFYDYYLFVGSQTGMFIFDATDWRVPKKVSEFRHARACDPVVVEGKRAYITLRSSNNCGIVQDAMHVVDITDVKKPSLITSFLMEGPMGLSIDNGITYVCDKSFVKIVDVTNEKELKLLSSIALPNCYDVIYYERTLFIVGPMGIYIYKVGDTSNPIRVAHISNLG